ncbi:MAG: alternative ribosome rescue aminoacyl-tRNA hydrolase ArfB [Acidimicrobiales bacterium]
MGQAGSDDDRIFVAPGVRIPRSELQVRFSASGGPGGQHANKAATRVELAFDVAASPSLLPVQRERVLDRLGPVLRIVVDDERSQARNRAIAEERFAERLAAALKVERPRRPTKPSRAAKERRLDAKRQRSQTKADRRRPHPD